MDAKPLDEVVRNIDARLTTVEQILPTLTTKNEFDEAVSRLATREELREEGERTRRHFDVVAERLEGQIRFLAESISSERERTDRQVEELRQADARLDSRVTRLDAGRRRR